MSTTITWIGIGLCIIHSGIFSGLNLAVFGVSRLRLEIEESSGNKDAERVLKLRRDSNYLLTTILWGNVAVNTLLALLSESVLTGVGAFVFSTVLITFVGEIVPQAYFSRNALRMAALLSPVLRFYQIVLFPVSKSTAVMLDWWLGKESIQYFRERHLREMIKKHIEADEADLDRLEGLGALNFMALDDLSVTREGQLVDPESIITLPFDGDHPRFPAIEHIATDPFLRAVQKSGRKWVILVNEEQQPVLVLDADGFLRQAFFGADECHPLHFCHRPIVAEDDGECIGNVLVRFNVYPEESEDDVIDEDIILVWGEKRRVITGADILGRLMRGIAFAHEPPSISNQSSD